MAFSVSMPALGESVSEGTITRWLKKEGDTVEVDEPLLEVSTDKVDTEIPSPAAGVLSKIVADEDETVEIGGELAVIDDGADGADGGSDDDAGDSSDDEDEKPAKKSDTSGKKAEKKAGKSEKKPAGKSGGAGTEVSMPELGESVTEGTITRWLKKVGESVEVDEPLVEVSTDKVDTEIPSPVAGTLLEIVADEDDTVDVGAVIAKIGDGAARGDSSAGEDDDDSSDSADDDTDADDAQDEVNAPEPDEVEPESGSGGSAKKSAESDGKAEKKAGKSEKKSAGKSGGAGTEVSMPELGESVTEGTITRWLKKVGESVEVDEPLVEVSTDKVDTEIPSPVAGTLLEIVADEDDTVDVGAVIAKIGDGAARGDSSAGEDDSDDATDSESDDSADSDDSDDTADEAAAAEQPKKAEKAEQPAKDDKPAKSAESTESTGSGSKDAPKAAAPAGPAAAAKAGTTPYVTPLVRKLADEHGVDLGSVQGTGIGGRIRKQDVLAAAEGGSASGGSAPAASGGSSDRGAAAEGGPSTKGVRPELAELRGTTQKANRIRKITAKKTRESLQTSAQLTQVHEADLSRVAQLRSKVKDEFQSKHGVKLTFLPFYAKAVCEALVSHPNVNASYDEDSNEITYHGAVHLGIAVDTENGLLSPVIHDAQDMDIPALAKAIADLAEKARSSKLTPDDLQGGTFTITNIGSEGALFDTPILVPPQAAMLGTGAIVRRPVVETDEDGESIAIRSMGYLPMTYDHRLVDGADAGRFLTTVRDRLETGRFESDLGL